jgi:type II secretion system protein N
MDEVLGALRVPTRKRWWLVAWALGALLLLVASLVASFPYNVTVSQLLAPYKLRLAYQDQHLNLPIGVRLEHVSLLSTADGKGHPLIESQSVALTPMFSSLLLGQKGLYLSAQIFGGSLLASLDQTDDRIKINFDASALSLADIQQVAPLEVKLNGLISGEGSAQINGPNLLEDRCDSTLKAKSVTLEITEGFPLINLGEVRGKVALKDGALTFQDVETHGGDVESTAAGVIHLAEDLSLSTIDARVALTPTPAGRDHFGLFFHMLPHPPDQGPFYIRGPLLSPSLT